MAARGADLRGPAGRGLAQHIGQVGPVPVGGPDGPPADSAQAPWARPPSTAARGRPGRYAPRPPGPPGPPDPRADPGSPVPAGHPGRQAPPQRPAAGRAASRAALAGSGRSAPGGRGPAPPRPRWRSAPRPAGNRGPRRPRRRAAPRGPGAAGRRARVRRGTPLPSMAAAGTEPAAPRMATAMPRSNPLPRLGRLAGDRPTVIRRCGHCSRLLTIAARIRSLASRSAVSGRPTSSSPGSPFWMSASISTGWPSTPTRAIEWVRATGIQPTPRTCSRREFPGPVPDQPDHVDAHLVEAQPLRRPASAAASRRSRTRFRWLTASSGLPYLSPERVLTSQITRTRRSSGHDVELAGLAPPVPVEDPQPGPFQVLRRDLLAAAAQLVLVAHLAPPPVTTVPEREAPRRGSCRAVDEGKRNRILWTGKAVLSPAGASMQAGRSALAPGPSAPDDHAPVRPRQRRITRAGPSSELPAPDHDRWRRARSAGASSRTPAPGHLVSSGTSSSARASSSTLTSLNVTTRTFFTKRAGRYMSQTQASCMMTSK